MNFEARIESLDGKLPKVSYHWDPETDILSVACKGGATSDGLNGTVDLEGADGSTPVTLAPSRARASARIPPPHPTSSTRLPPNPPNTARK